MCWERSTPMSCSPICTIAWSASAAPWRLALVTVFQFQEGLSDRQAAEAVRGRIDWKYALSLELTDAGFDASVLSEFRSRLVAHGASERLLGVLVEQFRERGLITARGKQRTDSTHVLGAVRLLNRLELVAETLRAALEDMATVAPEWLQRWVPPLWIERYGRRIEEGRLPKGEAARQQYAEQVGADGASLLARVQQADMPEVVRAAGECAGSWHRVAAALCAAGRQGAPAQQGRLAAQRRASRLAL